MTKFLFGNVLRHGQNVGRFLTLLFDMTQYPNVFSRLLLDTAWHFGCYSSLSLLLQWEGQIVSKKNYRNLGKPLYFSLQIYPRYPTIHLTQSIWDIHWNKKDKIWNWWIWKNAIFWIHQFSIFVFTNAFSLFF